MITSKIASIAAALILTASVDLLAQQHTPVAPGDRVRVSAPSVGANRLVGTLVWFNADSLLVDVERRGVPSAWPLTSVEKLEVSWGKKSSAGKGAMYGFLAGAGAGAILALATYEECTGWCFGPDPGPVGTAFIAAALLGGVGAGLGAVIGAVIPSERWETVPLDEIRVGLTPYQGLGLTVSATVAF